MGEYSGTITFNSVNLHVQNITTSKQQKTRKVIVGKTLTQVNIIGLNDTQWMLDITGLVTGTTESNLSTNRAAIEGLDDTTAYSYVDGIHDGTFIIKPGSLQFNDGGARGNMSYIYNMTLIEE